MNEPKKKRKKKERNETPNPRVLLTPLVGINGTAGGVKANKAGPMTCLVPRWNNQSGKQSSVESLEECNSYMVEPMKHEERRGRGGESGGYLAWGKWSRRNGARSLVEWWGDGEIFASEAGGSVMRCEARGGDVVPPGPGRRVSRRMAAAVSPSHGRRSSRRRPPSLLSCRGSLTPGRRSSRPPWRRLGLRHQASGDLGERTGEPSGPLDRRPRMGHLGRMGEGGRVGRE